MTEENNFSLGYVNDYQDGAIGEEDDMASTPTFELYEKVEVTHGMFIASHQIAETFFYQIEPSKTVKVKLNQILSHNFSISKAKVHNSGIQRKPSFFRKFKAFAKEKIRGITNLSIEPSRESSVVNQTRSKLMSMVSFLLASCIYLGGPSENSQLWDNQLSTAFDMPEAGTSTVENCYPCLKKAKKAREANGQGEKKNISLSNLGGGGRISCTFLNKKWSVFAIILALFSFGFQQII